MIKHYMLCSSTNYEMEETLIPNQFILFVLFSNFVLLVVDYNAQQLEVM